MTDKSIHLQIQDSVQKKLIPIFNRYHLPTRELEAALKWKPIVLILGNYSSGKSTFINEILGQDVQQTGQAPTDDSFTVITSAEADETPGESLGNAVVNDDNLPFKKFKAFGEQFMSHFRLKRVASDALKDLAIIDSPGMLDSVTEKGRGYDFPTVIGEMAKLADLVVLMFDPHKAGTIKETYMTIRNTLPDSATEDRIIFVMSRIDECDNLADLQRSYGTLCWNLSQMTGRKDIPRIFMTYSTALAGKEADYLATWSDERNQLKKRLLSVSGIRVGNVLNTVDKNAAEVRMIAEAMENFCARGRQQVMKTALITLILALAVFGLTDFAGYWLMGMPPKPMVLHLLAGTFSLPMFIIPTAALGIFAIFALLYYAKWMRPRFIRRQKALLDQLVVLDSAYQEQTWTRVKERVNVLVGNAKIRDFYRSHKNSLKKVNDFIENDLQAFFSHK